MSLDAVAEQEAIIARASILVGGRIYQEIPDETKLVLDTNGLVRPYIIISFTPVVPTARDRSLDGEEAQPHVMGVLFECWAATISAASRTAGAVRTRYTGWEPTANNSSQIMLRGGGAWARTDEAGRPIRYLETVSAETIINLSVTT